MTETKLPNSTVLAITHLPAGGLETLASLRAAVVPDGEIVLESTPNGAMGAFYFALHHPECIAGLMPVCGNPDFSYESDPSPSGFRVGTGLRDVCDRLWGTVPNDLPASAGGAVFQQLSGPWLASSLGAASMPPMVPVPQLSTRLPSFLAPSMSCGRLWENTQPGAITNPTTRYTNQRSGHPRLLDIVLLLSI